MLNTTVAQKVKIRNIHKNGSGVSFNFFAKSGKFFAHQHHHLIDDFVAIHYFFVWILRKILNCRRKYLSDIMDTISLQTGRPIDIYLPNIYRYMNNEYVDIFFSEGKLRLSSFKKFHEYPDEIRGDKNEGKGGITGIGNSGFQFHVMSDVGKEAYILCGSLLESQEMKRNFECDGCFRVVRPIEFSVAISNALTGFAKSFQGFCNYRSTRF